MSDFYATPIFRNQKEVFKILRDCLIVVAILSSSDNVIEKYPSVNNS